MPQKPKPYSDQIAARLERVRREMRKQKLDALLVRSTDRWLNEYVPTSESVRVFMSGFTGSMGEVLVTQDRAYLAVDGRYYLQADREVDGALYDVLRVPPATPIDTTIAKKLAELSSAKKSKKWCVGYDPTQITPAELSNFEKECPNVTLVAAAPSPASALMQSAGGVPSNGSGAKIRALDEARVGATVRQKLEVIAEKLSTLGVDALFVQKLDEIAYLTNLRGDELPYQATFKSAALVTADCIYVGLEPGRDAGDAAKARSDLVFTTEADLYARMGRGRRKLSRVGVDRSQNTRAAILAIEATGATAVEVSSPIGPMKARKNPAELRVMVAAFARADLVVDQATRWLCDAVVAGRRVSEAVFADKVHELFTASGATGLSFRVISAAGKNGAIIHYSEPSPRRFIRRGELMLLDTGAYYEEGYATDLTRTFLVDAPSAVGTADQRRYYTLVLKSAIAGMCAVVPEGAKGYQIDALCRAPLWAAGLDFNHGTGHGVGVNVHEFPPRVGPNASAIVEEGHVFSIEPGVYLKSFGGIRIENLCTIRKAPRRPGFLEVVPLTFSPLDERLIEPELLTVAERKWLASYSPKKKRRASRSSART
ncbi:MAG: M24 family metallopeptidase [Deltaproteobacteria bacterium]|nr:M24 family metallopeptidase [Deltaproteobacteria bacterium]